MRHPLSKQDFRVSITREFVEGSAIDPDLFDAAVDFLEDEGGWEPNHALGQEVRRFYQSRPPHRFEVLACLRNEDGSLWQAKPLNPRTEERQALDGEQKKPRNIKYEFPKGQGVRAFLPAVTINVWVKVAEKNNAYEQLPEWVKLAHSSGSGGGKSGDAASDPLQSDNQQESFWGWVQTLVKIPVVLTEGGKKALAALSQGHAAIALPGCNSGYSVKGGAGEPIAPKLIDDLKPFAVKGRKIAIAFDKDESELTQKRVDNAIGKTGDLLVTKGCKVFVADWAAQDGKGIDDVLAAQPASERANRADQIIESALSLKAWRRGRQIASCLKQLKQLDRRKIPATRISESNYLPATPALQRGELRVLDAPTGSGKTTDIKRLKAAAALAGQFVLVLSPLNSLGSQTAEDADLVHTSHYDLSDHVQTEVFLAEANLKGGVVCCVNSVHRLASLGLLKRKLLVIIDEAIQIEEELTFGGTLGNRQGEVLTRLYDLLHHAGRNGSIVLAEANLSDRTVEFYQSLSGVKPEQTTVYRHKRIRQPWDVQIGQGSVKKLLTALLAQLAAGKRIILPTTNQRFGKRLERLAIRHLPHLADKIIRIDSETNRDGAFTNFFAKPNQELELLAPSLLIYSPSMKSGVSIEGNFFDEEWAYFAAMHPGMMLQMLDRDRFPIPRIICCSSYIGAGSGDEGLANPRKIGLKRAQLSEQFQKMSEALSFTTDDEAIAQRKQTIEQAVCKSYGEISAIHGLSKSIAQEHLIALLEADGHSIRRDSDWLSTVEVWNKPSHHRSESEKEVAELLASCDIKKDGEEIKENWDAIQEEIWREDADSLAAKTLDENQDEKWAKEKRQTAMSLEDELAVLKIELRAEFPGIEFDDPEFCYQAITKNYGAMRRGVKLQASIENLDSTKERDMAIACDVLGAEIVLSHRLPREYARAALMTHLEIEAVLKLETYSEDSPEVQRLKVLAVANSSEVSYWLRLNVNDEQTGVQIANKLLKKLALKAKSIARPGSGDARERIWQIERTGAAAEARARLLEALQNKVFGGASTTCNKDLENIQIVDVKAEVVYELRVGDKISHRITGRRGRIVVIDGNYAQIDTPVSLEWVELQDIAPEMAAAA